MKIADSGQLVLTNKDTAYQLSATQNKVKQLVIVADGGLVAVAGDNSVDYNTSASLKSGASISFDSSGFDNKDGEIDLQEVWLMTDTDGAIVHYWTLD